MSEFDGIHCRMRQRVGQILVGFLGLLISVLGIAAIGFLFILAIRAGSAVGAALIAALASVAAALVIRAFERRKVMEEVRRNQLTDTYEEMAQVLHGRTIAQEKRNEVMLEFMRKSLLYASAKTIKAFSDWSIQIPGDEVEDPKAWRASSLRYEQFVKAMRSDLGIDNRKLQEGDLIRIGIEDFDEWGTD